MEETVNRETAPASPPRKPGVVIPRKPTDRQRKTAFAIYLVVKSITGTLRYRIDDQSGFFDQPPASQAIYCVWHNRLSVCLKAYFMYAKPRNATKGVAAMVSASRDGALLSAVLEAFNVQPVRGSTSRRGPQALLELARWAERGYDLAITPDGPRGPRYKVQPGVISVAQITGLPIIPFAFHAPWKIQFKSWDRFQAPLPFSRCDLIAAKPLIVPREASEAEREKLRCELEERLLSITRD